MRRINVAITGNEEVYLQLAEHLMNDIRNYELKTLNFLRDGLT